MVLAKSRSSFAGNAVMYTTGALLLQGINFIVAPLFTHILNTSQYGIAANYFFWATLFGIIISVQFGASLNNAFHKYGGELRSYMASIIFTYPLIACVLLAFIFIIRNTLVGFTGLSLAYLTIALLNGLFIAIVNTCVAYFICRSERRRYLILSISTTLLSVLLSLAFSTLMDDKLLGRLLGYSIGYLIVGALCIFYIFRAPAFRPRWTYLAYAFSISAPLVIHEVVYLISSQANRVLLLNIQSAAVAGIFSFAFSIGSISIILASAVNNAWTPWYFRMTKLSGMTNQINNALLKMISIFAVVMSLAILLAGDIIMLVVPRVYIGGQIYIPLIILSGYFIFVFNIISNYIVLKHKTRLIPFISIVSCAISISMNVVLIPKLGGLGSAMASLASSICLMTLAYLIARFRIGGINIRFRNILLPTSLVVANTIVYYLFFKDLPFRAICGVLIILLYVAFMILQKSIYPWKKTLKN